MSRELADRPNRRGWTPGRGTRVAAVATFAAVVVALAASQAFLPGIVASRVKANLTPFASDVSLSVQAAPAIELLFGRADDVNLHIGTLHAARGGGSITALLQQVRSTTNADASVAELIMRNGLHIENLWFHKRGAKLAGSAAVTPEEIQAALPRGINLAAAGAGARALSVSASMNVLGHTLSASAILEAQGGNLVLVPNIPLLPEITLFSDPQVAIDSLHFRTADGAYVFSAQGHLT